jgi:hypothetical protein
MQKTAVKKPGRLEFLDYLRGYFIVVIIVDHLWRYPSMFALISGEAKLWMTAAEGFVIISGFLIGYVRGFKGLNTSFKKIAGKLLKRSLILYAAMAVATLLYIAIEWSNVVHGMPYTPMTDGIRNWSEAIINTLTMTHPHTWVHFLALYARFLFIAIPIVWLLRKHKTWLVAALSIGTYIWGMLTNTEWMVWQVLFFIPGIAGFYFDTLRNWWNEQDIVTRRTILLVLFTYFIITLFISILIAFRPGVAERAFFSALDTQFNANAMLPARIVNALLWFTALAFIFHRITPYLKKWTFGVLEYIGSHSLQAYLVHGLVICLVNLTLPDSTSWIINTLYGLAAVLATYVAIRLPVVNKILPR